MCMSNILLARMSAVMALGIDLSSDNPAGIILIAVEVIAVLLLLKIMLFDIPGIRKSQSEESKAETKSSSSQKKNEDSSSSQENMSDDVLAAVITSAVAAFIESENNGNKSPGSGNAANTSFRVVSFKRKSGGRWNAGSR